MKTNILTLSALSMMTITSLTVSAQTEDRNASSARKHIVKEEHKLSEAKKDSAANYQNFKQAEEIQIIKNETNISVLKSTKVNDNKDVQAEYDNKVVTLGQRNDNLKAKLAEYNAGDKSVWLSFKDDFSTSMDKLKQDISALAKQNKK